MHILYFILHNKLVSYTPTALYNKTFETALIASTYSKIAHSQSSKNALIIS